MRSRDHDLTIIYCAGRDGLFASNMLLREAYYYAYTNY